jgi:hypothetical protein
METFLISITYLDPRMQIGTFDATNAFNELAISFHDHDSHRDLHPIQSSFAFRYGVIAHCAKTIFVLKYRGIIQRKRLNASSKLSGAAKVKVGACLDIGMVESRVVM